MSLRIGILNDLADGPPNPTDIESWLRLAVDDLIAAGRIDAEIEFIHGWGLGLPSGTAAAVVRAFETLVEQDVQLIVGPAVGDNALIATPLAERHRVPTLNWAGSESARSDYMFQLQVGSHEDESIVLVRHLASCGAQRVGVVYDDSPIGHGHLAFFRSEASIASLAIAAAEVIAPLAEHADEQIARLLAADVDAIAYLGLGISAPAVARALNERGWRGQRVMNTAGIRGYAPAFAQAVDGWIYVDLFSDSNATLAAFYQRTRAMARSKLAAAKGCDIGRLVAEGIARAPAPTRAGIRSGLEKVKWLPAAQGHEGTLLGFGKFDRGALHGRYLVLRQWRSGDSIEIIEA